MFNRSRWISFVLGLVSGPLLFYSCAFGPAAGHSKVLQRSVSPDGKYVASVVSWSQGAVGCHRDWVTIERVADRVNPFASGQVVYAQEDSYGESIVWKGANRLLISYQICVNGIHEPKYVTQSNTTDDGSVAIEYAIVNPRQEGMQHALEK